MFRSREDIINLTIVKTSSPIIRKQPLKITITDILKIVLINRDRKGALWYQHHPLCHRRCHLTLFLLLSLLPEILHLSCHLHPLLHRHHRHLMLFRHCSLPLEILHSPRHLFHPTLLHPLSLPPRILHFPRQLHRHSPLPRLHLTLFRPLSPPPAILHSPHHLCHPTLFRPLSLLPLEILKYLVIFIAIFMLHFVVCIVIWPCFVFFHFFLGYCIYFISMRSPTVKSGRTMVLFHRFVVVSKIAMAVWKFLLFPKGCCTERLRKTYWCVETYWPLRQKTWNNYRLTDLVLTYLLTSTYSYVLYCTGTSYKYGTSTTYTCVPDLSVPTSYWYYWYSYPHPTTTLLCRRILACWKPFSRVFHINPVLGYNFPRDTRASG